jgi:hypothetical protein
VVALAPISISRKNFGKEGLRAFLAVFSSKVIVRFRVAPDVPVALGCLATPFVLILFPRATT